MHGVLARAWSAASTTVGYVATKVDDALGVVAGNETAMIVLDSAFTTLSGYNFYFCYTTGIIGTAAKWKTFEVVYDTGLHTTEFVKDLYNAATGDKSSATWQCVMRKLHQIRLGWAFFSTVTGTGAVTEMAQKAGVPGNAANIADFGPHALLAKKNEAKPAAPAA